MSIGTRTTVHAMGFVPRGHDGRRRSPDEVKRDGWRERGLLAVSVDGEQLNWPERELVRQLGERLYGTERGDAPWLTGPAPASERGWRAPPR